MYSNRTQLRCSSLAVAEAVRLGKAASLEEGKAVSQHSH